MEQLIRFWKQSAQLIFTTLFYYKTGLFINYLGLSFCTQSPHTHTVPQVSSMLEKLLWHCLASAEV